MLVSSISELIKKASKNKKDDLYVSTAVITVSGSGQATAVSDTINFGGTFVSQPVAGVIQMSATDGSNNPVPLHASIYSWDMNSSDCYRGARVQVMSLQDVGSYTATINIMFVGRGFRITET